MCVDVRSASAQNLGGGHDVIGSSTDVLGFTILLQCVGTGEKQVPRVRKKSRVNALPNYFSLLHWI
jgi:hypothetical protein